MGESHARAEKAVGTMTPEQERARVQMQQQVEEDARAKGKAVRSMKSDVASDQDSWWDTTRKSVGTALRGTGEGIAATLDLPADAIEWTTGKDSLPSFANGYNSVVPAVPEGYENINDWAAIVGPAAIESIATLGAGAPAALAGAGLRQAAKAAARGTLKAAGRTVSNVGGGMVGSQVGGELGEVAGEAIGSPELGEKIGNIAGALTGPRGATGALRKGSEALSTPGPPARLIKTLTGRGGIVNPLTVATGGATHALTGSPGLTSTLIAASALAPPVARGMRNVIAGSPLQPALRALSESPSAGLPGVFSGAVAAAQADQRPLVTPQLPVRQFDPLRRY
jgi:hypothetical protein